eukprot:TRINITY_DN331_c0_g1_i1.p1 TRINITY_DN331_c0_g1~~TRINITY_DN331_c0_g1_i1.p1  ORF type:complete len:1482 (-),score=320.88 TRINITY_DN331_c0_g1_i1:622-5067(-)
MVETRASRRAAEEDSINSSQPARPHRVTKTASERHGPAPKTLESRTVSQPAKEDSFQSTQAPDARNSRSRSKTFLQAPAQTPRTRSRTRREAEESIASSEIRVATQHPHLSEEDSHNVQGKNAAKNIVTAKNSQTAESLSNAKSSRAPSKQRGESRSIPHPSIPQTPRTRSRARREAEESIASSEIRLSAANPHISEEDSHNVHSKNASKNVTAKNSQTAESMANFKSSRAPSKQRGQSRPISHPPIPQTPRTRSRARREAEESIASSEAGNSFVYPHPDEEDSRDLHNKKPTENISSSAHNQTLKPSSESVSTPLGRIRTVARRTRAYGAKNFVAGNESERPANVSPSVTIDKFHTEVVEKPTVSSVKSHLPRTSEPSEIPSPSSFQPQSPSNDSKGNEEDLSRTEPAVSRNFVDLEQFEQSVEQQIQPTELSQSKSQRATIHHYMTPKTESDKNPTNIIGFKSSKPPTVDPDAIETQQESRPQFKEGGAKPPISKDNVQKELPICIDAEAQENQPKVIPVDADEPFPVARPETSFAIALLPPGFDGFKHDEISAVPVEDDEPPPPPQIVKGVKGAIDNSSGKQPTRTTESDLDDEDKRATEPSAHSIGEDPIKPAFSDKAGEDDSKEVINLVEEDDSPRECEDGLPREAFDDGEQADALAGTPPQDSSNLVKSNESSSEPSQRRLERDRVSLTEGIHANRVSEQVQKTAKIGQAVEGLLKGEKDAESAANVVEPKIADSPSDGNSEKCDADTIKKLDINTNEEQINKKYDSGPKEPADSGDSARQEDFQNSTNVTNEESAFKVSSVDDVLKLNEKNMSVFFHRDIQTSKVCRRLLSEHFARQTKLEFGSDARYQFIPKRRKLLPPMGPLAHIEVGDHFDSDQIWEELELRNKPLLAYLQRKVNAILKQSKDAERALRRVTMNDEDSGSEHVELELPQEKEQQVGDDERGGIELNSEGNMLGAESEGGDAGKEGAPNGKQLQEERERRKTVRFTEVLPESKSNKQEEDQEVGGKGVKTKKKRRRLEDGFFNIEDMDRFADEAEELALSGKLVASDDDVVSDAVSDESEDEVEEIEVEDKLGRYLYSDFFDPPAKVSGSDKGVIKVFQLLNEDGSNDSVDNEEDPEKGLKADSLGAGSDADIEDDADKAELTPLQRMRARSTKRIQVLEEKSVAKKSWELRGEVSAFARPKDSLLDTEMQHDIAVKPKTFLSNEINESIEQVIRQRIVDGLFDDVVMRLPKEYIANKSKKRREELQEISQEKPTEGLAELYAKEFTEEREKRNKEMLSSQAVQKELEEPLGEQQREVNKLFEKLSKKLDALSSLHYTPVPNDAKTDVTVKTNVKAVGSEEAIPEEVSSASLLAPKEVFSVDKKDLVGEKELDKEERRAARRRRKSKKRKTQAADASRKEALAQTDPVVAEKRRAEAALIRRGKKPKVAESDPKLAAQSSTRNLIKRFGIVTNPGMKVPQTERKKPASHFRL